MRPQPQDRPAAAIALVPARGREMEQSWASSRRDLLGNRESAVIADVFPNRNRR
jgi:hypothetical protein